MGKNYLKWAFLYFRNNRVKNKKIMKKHIYLNVNNDIEHSKTDLTIALAIFILLVTVIISVSISPENSYKDDLGFLYTLLVIDFIFFTFSSFKIKFLLKEKDNLESKKYKIKERTSI